MLPPVRDLLKRHGIIANKRLGQHFLLDLNLTGRIAREAGDLSRGTTIEIGPGPGGLTRALLEQGAQVVAIERDERLKPLLDDIAEAYPGRIDIVWGDALAVDLMTIGTAPRRIVANLPYNIATDLVMGWLDHAAVYESMTLMVQREVAERFCAAPDTSAFGRLSVRTQWLCETEILFTVHPKAFVPPPKVESAVIRLTPRPQPSFPANDKLLQQVTAAAFGQRRKMLRQSLKRLAIDSGFTDGAALCTAAGIEPTARAGTLEIAAFCRLAELVDDGIAPSRCPAYR